VWTFKSRNANFAGEEFVLHLQEKWGNKFTWEIELMILNVYQSSKRIIFTNEDCSIYIDIKREALILFLKRETLSSQTIYFVSWTLFSTLFGILVFETKTVCQKIIVELFLLLWHSFLRCEIFRFPKTFYYLMQIIAHVIYDSWFWKWKTTFLPKVKSRYLFQELRLAKCTWGDNRCTWPLECTPITRKNLVFTLLN